MPGYDPQIQENNDTLSVMASHILAGFMASKPVTSKGMRLRERLEEFITGEDREQENLEMEKAFRGAKIIAACIYAEQI